jgi:hypothetical protein
MIYHPITYYWTVSLILDHSYLVGKSTSSKIADTKMSGFLRLSFSSVSNVILYFRRKTYAHIYNTETKWIATIVEGASITSSAVEHLNSGDGLERLPSQVTNNGSTVIMTTLERQHDISQVATRHLSSGSTHRPKNKSPSNFKYKIWKSGKIRVQNK